MVDSYGRWHPDYSGQQPHEDAAYLRRLRALTSQQQQQNVQQMQQTAIQQSGFVLVQSEQEARAYPVAPGNSITFKDESQPYCYVKTMGFNQLDRPTFERYRLVKEDIPPVQESSQSGDEYALKADMEALREEIDALKEKIKAQSEKKAVKAKKVTEDDTDGE